MIFFAKRFLLEKKSLHIYIYIFGVIFGSLLAT